MKNRIIEGINDAKSEASLLVAVVVTDLMEWLKEVCNDIVNAVSIDETLVYANGKFTLTTNEGEEISFGLDDISYSDKGEISGIKGFSSDQIEEVLEAMNENIMRSINEDGMIQEEYLGLIRSLYAHHGLKNDFLEFVEWTVKHKELYDDELIDLCIEFNSKKEELQSQIDDNPDTNVSKTVIELREAKNAILNLLTDSKYTVQLN